MNGIRPFSKDNFSCQKKPYQPRVQVLTPPPSSMLQKKTCKNQISLKVYNRVRIPINAKQGLHLLVISSSTMFPNIQFQIIFKDVVSTSKLNIKNKLCLYITCLFLYIGGFKMYTQTVSCCWCNLYIKQKIKQLQIYIILKHDIQFQNKGCALTKPPRKWSYLDANKCFE